MHTKSLYYLYNHNKTKPPPPPPTHTHTHTKKKKKYLKVSNIRCTLVGKKIFDHSDVVGAAPTGDYIFSLNLTHGFNGSGKDNSKTRWETFMFWDWVCLILENWRYIYSIGYTLDSLNADSDIWMLLIALPINGLGKPASILHKHWPTECIHMTWLPQKLLALWYLLLKILVTKSATMWFYCNMVSFLQNSQNRYLLLILIRKLTHWGRMTHICIGNLTIIGSDNGLSPGWRQSIIWTNDRI